VSFKQSSMNAPVVSVLSVDRSLSASNKFLGGDRDCVHMIIHDSLVDLDATNESLHLSALSAQPRSPFPHVVL
jgi:hypothetical protein